MGGSQTYLSGINKNTLLTTGKAHKCVSMFNKGLNRPKNHPNTMPATNSQLSTSKLRQAFQLSEQIDSLQQRLNALLGGGSGRGGAAQTTRRGKTGGARRKPKMSAEARERIAAAQRARWAQRKKAQGAKGTKAGGGATRGARKGVSAQRSAGGASAGGKRQTARKGSGGMTPEARARIAEAMRARWAAKRKAAAPSSTATPAATK